MLVTQSDDQVNLIGQGRVSVLVQLCKARRLSNHREKLDGQRRLIDTEKYGQITMYPMTHIACCDWSSLPKNDRHVGEKHIWRTEQYMFDKEQPCACFGVARRCVARIYLWLSGRDERSGVLISVDGTWRSDWPERVMAVGVAVV